MNSARALLSMLLLVGVACRPASAPSHAPPPDLEASFRAELDRLREDFTLPGATAAFVKPDGSVGVAASGLADIENRTPMTPRSRMLAASIGKSFVAATAIALAREGHVDLDGRIGKWLSERPWFSRLPNHNSITLRHLLTHTAGLPDHVHTPEFALAMARRWREPDNPFPPEALVQYALDKPALFPAGQDWSYTDTGYILAGLIIERVVRRPYYDEVRRRFLGPLSLDATYPVH